MNLDTLCIVVDPQELSTQRLLMKFKQETSIAIPMRNQDTGDISALVPLFIF